jgi:hypothetical protein
VLQEEAVVVPKSVQLVGYGQEGGLGEIQRGGRGRPATVKGGLGGKWGKHIAMVRKEA